MSPQTGTAGDSSPGFATEPASDRRTPTSPDPLVSLVVPVYNEGASLEDVLRRVYELPLRTEVIAVDDGSTDETLSILRSFEKSKGLTVLQHDRNRGKGAAVRTGIAREITSEVLRRKLRLYELPIAYYGRTPEEGKKISWRDGLPAIWTLLRLRFGRPQR